MTPLQYREESRNKKRFKKNIVVYISLQEIERDVIKQII